MTTRHRQSSYASIPKDIGTRAYSSAADMMDKVIKRFAAKTAFGCAGQTLSCADSDRLSRDFAAHNESFEPERI